MKEMKVLRKSVKSDLSFSIRSGVAKCEKSVCFDFDVCVFLFFLFMLGFMSGRNVVSYLTASPSVEYSTYDAKKICTLTIFFVQNVRFYACKPTLFPPPHPPQPPFSK